MPRESGNEENAGGGGVEIKGRREVLLAEEEKENARAREERE